MKGVAAAAAAAAGLLVLAEAATARANSRTVPLRFEKHTSFRQPGVRNALAPPASGYFSTDLANDAATSYVVNITVGTPPQPIQVQLDTGSTLLWVPSPDAGCQGGCSSYGDFTKSKSSTYKLVAEGGFNTSYGGGSASGDIFTDNLTVGPFNVGKGLPIGLANKTDEQFGILGVSGLRGQFGDTPDAPAYPTFLNGLLQLQAIQTAAYSIYLDDIQDSTGTVLFGGVDTAKYTGDLIGLPTETTQGGFNVTWTGLNITSQGKSTPMTPSGFEQNTLLDSGTTYCIMPAEVTSELVSLFNATEDSKAKLYTTSCNFDNTDATLDFQFGGDSGPVIKVPIRQFLVPVVGDNGPLSLPNGEPECYVGVEPAQPGAPNILGDSFLRGAYVVYDLQHQEIGIANAKFNTTDSHIVEIPKAGISGLVSGVATPSSSGSFPGSTGSAGSGSGSGANNGSFVYSTVTLSPTATAFASSTGSSPGSSTTPPKKNAASLMVAPRITGAVLPMFVTAAFSLFGGMLLL